SATRGVAPGRGVGHEREVLVAGADEIREGTPGLVETVVELTGEEPHRFSLHLRAQFCLVPEHRGRARPERAVIEKRDFAIQRPELVIFVRHASDASPKRIPCPAIAVRPATFSPPAPHYDLGQVSFSASVSSLTPSIQSTRSLLPPATFQIRTVADPGIFALMALGACTKSDRSAGGR